MSQIKIVGYKSLGKFSNEKACVYGEHIQGLAERLGGVTKQDLVEDGRSPDSPLHEYFEWKDDVAAERYREVQAQYLVRHIVIEYRRTGSTEVEEIRLIHSAKKKGNAKPFYVTVNQVDESDDYRAQAVETALRSLESWIKTYGLYHELWGLTQAITQGVQPRTTPGHCR